MSLTTWTPTEVASNAIDIVNAILWRGVESQHRFSTLALVDTVAEQKFLEELLEQSKPSVPAEAQRLHYLLATPFRYPPLPQGSRFRSATDAGVLYGADEIRTVCAEVGFWSWRFLMDSPALERIESSNRTLFAAAITTNCIDLRQPPFLKDRLTWTDTVNYAGCQSIATSARDAQVGAIRYESVRDPEHGCATAVLTPLAFQSTSLREQQNWKIVTSRQHVLWRRDSLFDDAFFEFDTEQWSFE